MENKEFFGNAVPSIKIIKGYEREGRKEYLLRFEMADVKRYGIYVADTQEATAEFFVSDEESAVRFFESVSQGALSVEHLADVVRDFCTAAIL